MKVYRTVNIEPKIKGIEYISFFIFLVLVMVSTTILVNAYGVAGIIADILVIAGMYLLFKIYSEIDKVKIFAIIDKFVHRTFSRKLNSYFSTQRVKIK